MNSEQLPDLEKDLIPMFTTNPGGKRKEHVGYYEKGPLCGLKHAQIHTSPFVKVDEEWLLTGLGSGNLCLKCAKIAISIIEKEL